MAPAKSLQHFRVLDYHLCNEFPIRILFWVPLLQKMQLVFFLGEGRFEIKVTSISFLHSKIKAMWIYTKSIGTWRFLWADRDMIFICRAFHFQNMFSFGRQCFWQFFFKSSYLYLMQQTVSDVSLSKCFLLDGGVFDSFFFQVILSLFDVSCGTDPRIIRHRIHGHYKSVFFYVYYKFPNFKGGRCPLKLLS